MMEMEKTQFLVYARNTIFTDQHDRLIISDKEADSQKLFSQEQIYVSQYALAIKDESLSPALFSTQQIYSPPILFALAQKLLTNGDYQSAIELFAYNLKGIGVNHRPILIYNIAILQKVNKKIGKALFHLQTLLKEEGKANDYYTYEYVRLLMESGRINEAYIICKRHVNKKRPKIQQIYLLALQKMIKKHKGKNNKNAQEHQLIKQLISKFNNKNVPYLTAYNIGLLLKKSYPEEALIIFKQVQTFLKTLSYHHDILRLVRIHILQILQRIINFQQKNDKENLIKQVQLSENPSLKQTYEPSKQNCAFWFQYDEDDIESMLAQCTQIYRYLLELYPDDKYIEQKLKQTKDLMTTRSIVRDKKKQNQHQIILNIIETQANNPHPIKLTNSFMMDYSKKTKKVINDKVTKPISNESQMKIQEIYNKKRKQNDQRLKFLMKKEKELKKFFQNFKKNKNNTGQSFELCGMLKNNAIQKYSPFITSPSHKNEKTKTVQQNSKFHPSSINNEDFSKFQKQFEQKKKKIQVVYKQGELNGMIQDFMKQWLHQTNKNKSKKETITSKSYRDKIDKFIKGLDNQDRCISQNRTNLQIKSNLTRQASYRQISSNKTSRKQTFRIKKSPGHDGILLGAKNNDKILNELRNHAEKKNSRQIGEESRNISKKNIKIFQKELQKVNELINERNLEFAHDQCISMYKIFKENQEKQKILLKIAEIFEIQGFQYEAEKTYAKCTKYNNIQAFFKLGCLQVSMGQLEKGIENLEKANCIDRYNCKIQIKLVYAYSLVDETTDRALALANNILKRNPQSLQALLMTSKILSKKGKLKEALDIALAIGQTKESASIFHYIGLLYLNDSNVGEAFKFFQKAIEIDSTHTSSLVELATIVSEVNPNQAIEILEKVIKYDENNHHAYARLGKIYQTFQGKYQKALVYYKKGLEIQRTYEAYMKIGDCLVQIGSIVDAYLNYKEALGLRKTPEVYQRIAEIHEKQGQDRKAIDSYCLALKQLPQNNLSFGKKKKILLRLGSLSLNGQQYEYAINYLQEAAQMQQSLQIYKMLGEAYFGKGEFAESLAYFKKAASESQEDDLEILENIAMCYDKQEQFLASKEIYEKILSVDPKNIKCLNNMANIYLILGKTNEAFYWFQFMLQQIPYNIEKRLRVADIYATIGDWSKVQQHLSICYKQKQHDIRVLERMVNLYKQKREIKQANKFEKRLNFLKQNKNGNQNT